MATVMAFARLTCSR